MPGRMTALVTGSSKGLGRSIALTFARAGYDLIIHGRDKKRLEQVQSKMEAYEARCDVVIGQLSMASTIELLASAAERRNLDVLVNNAAAYIKKPIELMTAQEIQALVHINLIAPILLTRAIFPIFKAKQNGFIININSLAGKQPGEGQSVYCATKHGLRGFSTALQFDATRTGVKIIDFYPGAMKTDMTKERGPADLLIEPDEVAQVIVRLCDHYKTLRIKEVEIGRRNY